MKNYNSGWENLRSLGDRSPEDRRRIASMGGTASGAAKKERRRLEDLANLILSKPLPDDDALRSELESHGVDPDCDAGIVLAMTKKALGGDVKAATWVRDILGENPGNRVEIGFDQLDAPLESLDLSKFSDDELRAMLIHRSARNEQEDC